LREEIILPEFPIEANESLILPAARTSDAGSLLCGSVVRDGEYAFAIVWERSRGGWLGIPLTVKPRNQPRHRAWVVLPAAEAASVLGILARPNVAMIVDTARMVPVEGSARIVGLCAAPLIGRITAVRVRALEAYRSEQARRAL
jgi:hypothetical protein